MIEEKPNQISQKSLPVVILAQLDAREGKMGRFRIDDFRFLIEEKPNQINPKSCLWLL